MKSTMTALVLCSTLAFAGPPPAPKGPPLPADAQAGRQEERGNRMRMMLVVGIADALNLTEAEALRLGDKVKGFEEKRRPVREQMHEGMKVLKAASDGDPAALPQVDGAVQRVLDGRAQMAQLDKEMFTGLSQGLSPQKRAQLAIFLARFQQQAKEFKGGRGRHGQWPGHGEMP